MSTALTKTSVVVFTAIALEQVIDVNNSASALVGAVRLWAAHAVAPGHPPEVSAQLAESVMATAQIVFFRRAMFDDQTSRIVMVSLSIGGRITALFVVKRVFPPAAGQLTGCASFLGGVSQR